jgi:hypothetical protein
MIWINDKINYLKILTEIYINCIEISVKNWL